MFRRSQSQFNAKRHKTVKQPKKISWNSLLVYFKILLVSIILAVIIWSIYSWRVQSNLLVEKVKVVATYKHLEQKVLQNIIASYTNTNFFDVDVLSLRMELMRLPWVYQVSIKRRWPNAILVDIEEQKAIAQWKDKALLNSDGMLFTPPKETFPQGLPFLSGPENEIQDIVINYQKIEEMLIGLEFKITRLEVDDQQVWHLVLNDETIILLNSEHVLDDLKKFISMYPKIKADHPNEIMDTADLRYKNGMAVKWNTLR